MTLRPPLTTMLAAFGAAAVVSAAGVGPAGRTGQTPPPQVQQPVFRAGIDIVQVDVSVLDRDHRPVRHPTTADFSLLEEGRPQEIVVFAPVDIPTVDLPATPWLREAPPDVRTNDLGDARLFAIIMDDAATPSDMQLARSARQKLVPMHDPGIGRHEAPATCATPGSADRRVSASPKKPAARGAS